MLCSSPVRALRAGQNIIKQFARPIPALKPFSSDAKDSGSKTVTLKSTSPLSSTVKIYTRTGDGGKSSLFTGERRLKSDDVFEALGTTDELSSHIGLAIDFASEKQHPYVETLQRAQCLLQDIGSAVATPASSARETHVKRTEFSGRHTKELEMEIDRYSKMLPPLTKFILPGGGQSSSTLHICRSICRRAERRIVPLVKEGEVSNDVLIYVNRLSDFLFVAARIAAKLDNREETIYTRQYIEEEAAKQKKKDE